MVGRGRWMLAADPEAGLEMFMQMKPPLPPSTVLPILRAEVLPPPSSPTNHSRLSPFLRTDLQAD
jgi:hypothetical protein